VQTGFRSRSGWPRNSRRASDVIVRKRITEISGAERGCLLAALLNLCGMPSEARGRTTFGGVVAVQRKCGTRPWMTAQQELISITGRGNFFGSLAENIRAIFHNKRKAPDWEWRACTRSWCAGGSVKRAPFRRRAEFSVWATGEGSVRYVHLFRRASASTCNGQDGTSLLLEHPGTGREEVFQMKSSGHNYRGRMPDGRRLRLRVRMALPMDAAAAYRRRVKHDQHAKDSVRNRRKTREKAKTKRSRRKRIINNDKLCRRCLNQISVLTETEIIRILRRPDEPTRRRAEEG